MIRTIRTFAALAVTLCSLALAGAARAGDSAQAFIQSRQNEVTALLHQSGGAQRDKKIWPFSIG